MTVPSIDRLLRYEASLERAFDRTLILLERLQRMRLGMFEFPPNACYGCGEALTGAIRAAAFGAKLQNELSQLVHTEHVRQNMYGRERPL